MNLPRRDLRALFAVAALSSACSKQPEASSGGASSAPVPPSAKLEHAQAPQPGTQKAAPALPDGCFSAFADELERDAGTRAALSVLAARCAPGMAALGPPAAATLAEGSSDVVHVRVDDPRRCLRALAVGGAGIRDLELVLSSADARRLGQDTLVAPFALVAERGPVCADAAGTLELRVRVSAGTGEVAYGLFQAE